MRLPVRERSVGYSGGEQFHEADVLVRDAEHLRAQQGPLGPGAVGFHLVHLVRIGGPEDTPAAARAEALNSGQPAHDEPHEMFDSAFYNGFRRLVNWCVAHRWLTIAATVALFALGVLGMGKVNSAASMQAILLNPALDFSKAYYLITGVAGTPPSRGTIGDVSWCPSPRPHSSLVKVRCPLRR